MQSHKSETKMQTAVRSPGPSRPIYCQSVAPQVKSKTASDMSSRGVRSSRVLMTRRSSLETALRGNCSGFEVKSETGKHRIASALLRGIAVQRVIHLNKTIDPADVLHLSASDLAVKCTRQTWQSSNYKLNQSTSADNDPIMMVYNLGWLSDRVRCHRDAVTCFFIRSIKACQWN